MLWFWCSWSWSSSQASCNPASQLNYAFLICWHASPQSGYHRALRLWESVRSPKLCEIVIKQKLSEQWTSKVAFPILSARDRCDTRSTSKILRWLQRNDNLNGVIELDISLPLDVGICSDSGISKSSIIIYIQVTTRMSISLCLITAS